ncbi:MAG: hypothetical protein NVS3B17_02510 [Vulcanimicrobiaceae bacterium]
MRFVRSLAATGAVLATLAVASHHARAAVDPGGYVGKGQLVVQTAFAGVDKLTVGGNIALEQRGTLLRLDVLSLGLPGSDPTVSSIMGTQLFPAGGFTIVYDRKAGTYTLWSNAKRNYYTSAPAVAASPKPAPGPIADAIGTAGSLFAPLALVKSVRDDTTFNASLALVGHGPINGHPATGLDYQVARTSKSGEKTDVHGRLQLADDLDEVPVQITASVKTKSIPESSLRLDLTSLAKAMPAESDFAVPTGFARANDLGAVLGRTLGN